MITGRLLFQASSFESLIHRILTTDIGAELGAAEAALPGSGLVLERALHSDPSERYPDARSISDDLRDLGRAYPPEADMAEVISRLLPELDRTDVRNIENSQDLELDASLSDGTDPDHCDFTDSSSMPIQAADPCSTGWQRFSSVLTGSSVRESSFSATTPLVDFAEASRVPLDVADSIQLPVSPGRQRAKINRIPMVLAGSAILLVASVVLALWLALGGDLPSAPPGSSEPDNSQVKHLPAANKGTVPSDGEGPTVEVDSTADREIADRSQDEASDDQVNEETAVAPILTSSPPTPEPVRAEPSHETVETDASVDEEASPSTTYAPGSVSLYTRPWADIYVDGAHVGSTNSLKGHSLEGGPHQIRLVCAHVQGKEKVFDVVVDGDAVNLGCWDFSTMTPCAR